MTGQIDLLKSGYNTERESLMLGRIVEIYGRYTIRQNIKDADGNQNAIKPVGLMV